MGGEGPEDEDEGEEPEVDSVYQTEDEAEERPETAASTAARKRLAFIGKALWDDPQQYLPVRRPQ